MERNKIVDINGYTINLDKVCFVGKPFDYKEGYIYKIYFGGEEDNYISIDNNKFPREDFIELWRFNLNLYR